MMIKRKPIALTLLAVIIAQLVVSCTTTETSMEDRPNIILIMSDDMGYSDLGCFGGEINTPNLNQLAANGLRFTQFYNAARCCPTRASLLTGLYPHQTGIGHMTNVPDNPTNHNYNLPGYQGFLQTNTNTLAEVLGGAGYHTLMSGKWHLGMADSSQWPLQRGFDKFYGILSGAANYFKPDGLRGITFQNEQIEITDPDYYTTDAFTDHAIEFIDGVKSDDQPFFLYLAYNAPHWPLNAPKEDIDKYRGRYDDGWQTLREERYQRMKQMGLVEENWPLSAQDSPDWDTLSQEVRDEMSLRMSIYAAQVDRMDQNIGRLTQFLQETGELDNTIIVFLNDNGACAEGGTFGGGPADILETKKGYWLTYGQSWANASNTPYREYKHYVHEGGISTPMIVHWPKGIEKSKNGSLVKDYAFLPDIMATFKDLANADYALEKDGQNVPTLAGKSLGPLLVADVAMDARPIFWEHEGNKALRLGNLKLVSKWNNSGPQTWELYDVVKDRTEQNDLSDQMSEKKEEMIALWQNWADTHQVEPWDEILQIIQSKNASH